MARKYERSRSLSEGMILLRSEGKIGSNAFSFTDGNKLRSVFNITGVFNIGVDVF